jgi:hypothetical protein
MTCPSTELLSRWVDRSLDPHEAAVVGRHAGSCAACRRKADELRAVGAWIVSAVEPGPACLSADDMAVVIEGARMPSHVRSCPRCAAELRALRNIERKVTHRTKRPAAPLTAWAAAAAIFIAVGILLLLANRQERTKLKDQVVRTAPQKQPVVIPATPVPDALRVKPEPLPIEPPPVLSIPQPPPLAPPLVSVPVAPPVVVPATPEPEKREPARVMHPTLVEPARLPAAINIHSGSLLSNADGRWVKPLRIEEGMTLRAEGRTQFDFAQARITVEGASRFLVAKEEFSLAEGAMSAEVGVGSRLALVLDEQRIVPQTINARVLFCAKPDRIVVEEGSAKWKDMVLHEGVEHAVRKDRIEPQKRRTLPAAARARETLTWRMDLSNANAVRRLFFQGRLETGVEGKLLVSEPLKDNSVFHAQASLSNGGEEQPLYTVKPNTAIRFHYFVTQPGVFELVTWNATKGENFNKPLEPVVRQWTTMTVYVRDIPVNGGGKKVTCDVGDRYVNFGWFVGKPGMPSEVQIDRFEILEVER